MDIYNTQLTLEHKIFMVLSPAYQHIASKLLLSSFCKKNRILYFDYG